MDCLLLYKMETIRESVKRGMGGAGAMHTDYNFKFAKRFFNNRLSFSVYSAPAEKPNGVE